MAATAQSRGLALRARRAARRAGRGPVQRVRAAAATKEAAAGKKVCVITGASSGLGLYAAKALADKGWFVVMACRDWAKAESAAKRMGIDDASFAIMHLDLAATSSVRAFVDAYQRAGLPADALVCNAAIYLPLAKEPTATPDGFEMSVGTNHLGHFLLANLMLPTVQQSEHKRVVILGSVTGNANTVAGKVPPMADLGDLAGMRAGFDASASEAQVMIDGKEFDGAKAYKDSKVCNMLTMREMHNRFHESTGVVFSSLYPGCIADSDLFRNHTSFFRWGFPILQQKLTKGYVSQEEAGSRLAAIVADPAYSESGAYWSWAGGGDSLYDNYNADDRTNAFVNEPSDEVQDDAKAKAVFELSARLVGL